MTLAAIDKAKAAFAGSDRWHAKPITRAAGYGKQRPIVNPAKPSEVVGTVSEAAAKQVATAVRFAVEAQPAWARRPVAERAAILNRAADLYEANAVEFFALATREAGKSLADGVAEVREAVDFLRYYAAEAANAETGTRSARRHRLHFAVEFSARHLHRPDRGGTRHRQFGHRQAGRADAADRLPRRRTAARGRRAGRCHPASARRRPVGRRRR